MQIDSSMIHEEAVQARPQSNCPNEVLKNQELVEVKYFNFEGRECVGQIVVSRDVVNDIKKVFDLIYEIKFPIAKVIPISNKKYQWDDDVSCNDNNSSAFNYRMIAGTNRLSNHALGKAIDINPIQNPYIKYDLLGQEVFKVPKESTYDKKSLGTLYAENEIVQLFKHLGWKWGGDWSPIGGPVDYQHFEKP